MTGAMVSKLPFTHPKDVPDMIDILRHQAAYNTLVSSCISGTTKYEGNSFAPLSIMSREGNDMGGGVELRICHTTGSKT